jgi:hypothetical protein
LLGKDETYADKIRRTEIHVGILMPGYTVSVVDKDGKIEEKKIWDNPTQEEINAMDTPFFRKALDLYLNFKASNSLPHGSGFMNERVSVMEIIRIFEQESNRYDSWYMKNYEALKGDEEED